MVRDIYSFTAFQLQKFFEKIKGLRTREEMGQLP